MVEKSFFEDEKADLLGYLYKLIDQKNLKFVYIFVSLFILLRFVGIFRFSSSRLLDSSLMFFEVILLSLVFYVPYYVKFNTLPLIAKARKENREGKIWFLKEISRDEDYLFYVRSRTFFYNNLILVLGLLGLGALLLLFLFIIIAIPLLILLPFIPSQTFSPSWIFVIIPLLLSFALISLELLYKSKVTKKQVYYFLYTKFDKSNKKDKSFYFKQILLFIRKYNIFKPYNNLTSFSKDVMKDISAYYENIVLSLIDEKKVYSELFPKLDYAIRKDNYTGIIEHLNYIDTECRKNKEQYAIHLGVLSRCNKHINNKIDKISLFKEISKLRLKDHSEAVSYKLKSIIKRNKRIIGRTILIVIIIGVIIILIKEFPGNPISKLTLGDIYQYITTKIGIN